MTVSKTEHVKVKSSDQNNKSYHKKKNVIVGKDCSQHTLQHLITVQSQQMAPFYFNMCRCDEFSQFGPEISYKYSLTAKNRVILCRDYDCIF